MQDATAINIFLLLTAILSPTIVQGILLCQNGATFDPVRYGCSCTPHYHGRLCELTFVNSDPCVNWTSVQVIRDERAVHRFGNRQRCGDMQGQSPCIDFSAIQSNWYRLVSPAGNYLISKCPTTETACGSRSPYILVDEVPEDNANRILSRARAYRYRPGLNSTCYIQGGTSYPVRILKCSAALSLYYLQPLPSIDTHYCIGDKRLCDAGLTSIDGSGFEPCISDCLSRVLPRAVDQLLRLDYIRQPNGEDRASFFCNVYDVFRTNSSSGADGVRFLIDFELTYRNGTSVPIPRCRWENVSIDVGQNKKFECPSERVLTSRSNLYGGSLVCRVEARCGMNGSQYDSIHIRSNSHGFFFKHWFQGGVDVIRPDQPVSLCISSENIPVMGDVTFYISVGRQQIMLNDRINVAAVRRDGNDSLSCGISINNRRYALKRICQDLILYNHDPENRIPLGLAEADQISVIKVNISYRSAADGLYTLFMNRTWFSERIQNIELKVDLSSLQTNVKTYMHAYTDPWIKRADSAYTSSGTFFIGSSMSDEYYILLRHNMLPYEIQGKVQSSYFTEITIRYVYDVIHIYGSNGSLHYKILSEKLPPGVLQNALKKKPDGLPFGVTLESTGRVMKVRFDLYGTILYIWGFQTKGGCAANFVMSNAQLHVNNQSCTGSVLNVGSRFSLDLMLVPGFYDTPNLTDGLIFGKNRSPISDPKEIPLSSSYEMKHIKANRSRVDPTEVLSICTCDGNQKMTSNCFVSIDNVIPTRRQAPHFEPPIRLTPTPSSSSSNNLQTQFFSSKISQQDADSFCNKFVQIQLSKSVSTEICSATKDPTGQADYISQFKLICAQYAVTLGTYDFSQSLFNSLLGMCYTDMTYNATVVLGNSSQIEILKENICPGNCSNRGSCINGECTCNTGFWGTSCELEIAQRDLMPVEISLLQRDAFCSSENCSAAYLMVKPYLKTADSMCNILVNSSFNYTAPSVYMSGNIVMCELKRQHEELVERDRMYQHLQIRITAATWESINSVDLLLHQARCDSQQVACNEATMTCRASRSEGQGNTRKPESVDGNQCSAVKRLNSAEKVSRSSCLISSGLVCAYLALKLSSAVGI